MQDIRLDRQADQVLLNQRMTAHHQRLEQVRRVVRHDLEIISNLEGLTAGTSLANLSHNRTLGSCTREDPVRSGILQISLTELRRCKAICACSCHQHRHYRSPGFLDFILGCLFLGYSGTPYASQKCDVKTCQKIPVAMASLKYVFPFWLLERTMYMTILLSQTKGLELIIRCVHVRPIDSGIFQANMNTSGTSEILKSMLKRGEASALDVENAGRSGLWVSFLAKSRHAI